MSTADYENQRHIGLRPTKEGQLPRHFPAPVRHVERERLVTHSGADPEVMSQMADTYGRQLEVQLAMGNWEAAHRLVELARRDAHRADASKPLLECSLAEIGVPVRICNQLEVQHQALTVGDLTRLESKTLLGRVNFGTKSLDVLWQTVLKFATERDADREILEMQISERNLTGV